MSTPSHRALNHAAVEHPGGLGRCGESRRPRHSAGPGLGPLRAINVVATGEAPEWVELIPPGPMVEGRDGRRWPNPSPEAVIAATQALGRDLPVDWEHATELRAPAGHQAPAAGWIVALDLREGAIWGRVEWTEAGAAAVAGRAYRYLSPVFDCDREAGVVLRLVSVGLTNQPNLRLTALNRTHREDSPMDKILQALGLAADAGEDAAVTAITALRGERDSALNRAQSATPSLDRYVPRADYDAQVTRAANAEQKLAEREQADTEAAIEAEVGAALKAGKITPATADYHRAMCRTEGGLAQFRAFVAAAPAVAPDSGLDGRAPPGDPRALNTQEREVCAQLGISHEDFIRTRNEEAAQ